MDAMREGRHLLSELVSHDDWLPEAFARCVAERYQQNLLHCDARERFSIVSFVWAPAVASFPGIPMRRCPTSGVSA
jgi:predicted metal-dependent enzyme (double-stranded beta helix superfamily)